MFNYTSSGGPPSVKLSEDDDMAAWVKRACAVECEDCLGVGWVLFYENRELHLVKSVNVTNLAYDWFWTYWGEPMNFDMLPCEMCDGTGLLLPDAVE